MESARGKDFPIFSTRRSQKNKEKQKNPSARDGEGGEASASLQLDTSLSLSEIRAVGTRLKGIEGQLGKIASSIAVLENAFAALTARVTDTKTQVKQQISTLEDTGSTHSNQMSNLHATVEQLQAKMDDLENQGCRKNMKIVGLPEKA
ncbi:uncharacterized [Tachysurus ichikawai]